LKKPRQNIIERKQVIILNFLSICIHSLRTVLIVLSIYHIYKRDFKLLISTGAVFILTFLLWFLDKVFAIRLDLFGGVLYIAIIFMTIYLGSALKFYDKYAWWDRLIHALSGIALVSFGVAVSRKAENLSSLYILFFSFTFSISLHVVWEVLEYIFDCIFHMDNQRWQKVNASNNHVSESAVQPAGLVDTMNDTILCIVGTAIACLVWWFIL